MLNDKAKYYVRIRPNDQNELEEHLKRNDSEFVLLSYDVSTVFYSVKMSTMQELNLKLSFQLVGCMNFTKTMSRLTKDLV